MKTWKPIAGFEGRYDVCEDGSVRSRLNGRIKYLKPGASSSGYLTVNLYDGSIPKRPRSHSVHQLVAAAFLGECPEGKQVDHIDGNKQNNASTNLRYVTNGENIAAQKVQGTEPTRYRGCEHVTAKLNEHQVRAVRALSTAGFSATQIAKCFDVHSTSVCSLLRGETYRNIH